MPLQQPVGHELASQTHLPDVVSHSCPARQALQELPPVPHEVGVWEPYASQDPVAPPLQQPFGQVLSSQVQVPTVMSQTALGHAPQAAPPVPQEVADSDA